MNVRELVRFELEGLAISLPPELRVERFDVRMEPLPRTSNGEPAREAIAAWLQERNAQRGSAVVQPARADGDAARIVALVQLAVGPGVQAGIASNLELDLGLDSLDRVELLARLEACHGTRIPIDVAQTALVVGDLVDAFRGAQVTDPPIAGPWPALLDACDLDPRPLLGRPTWLATIVYGIAWLLVRGLVRPQVEGRAHLPAGGPFIITPNHQSYIDPFVLAAVLPFRVFRELFTVGAAEYFQSPIAGWLARRLKVVPVDPDANLIPAMQAGACGLKHGRVLLLFPEGERSIDGRVKTFRKGAAILSKHAGAPIVPVAIDGTFAIWPRSRCLDGRRLLPWSGHRTSVRFGAPIAAPGPERSCVDHIAVVRAAVEAMWSEVQTTA